ncbi:P-loop containing nucleoside triphosphate hydrolase protein [Coniophora puteana RWD-64-598 SS2]|uniref:Guanine nucleotide-binding protein-like 1 n=1 Tax=Coniophora puteana (strain RWD-64-598) TaxID=741705 RepID=A0A5M3N6F9_CONPW|nr:P-loop containing nucleoside triphosphate hydrolase protein [Coniophora puteana RWD-64-598 SS2]EIW87030.1 P-loop containing nucleoside triphosphate hydrolase protein [Coniophora puteana RWD-64-598 SS2]
MRRSGKQRKAELQHKRAVKRGDAPPDPKPTGNAKRRRRRPPPMAGHTQQTRDISDLAAQSARKLQSAFLRLDPQFLQLTKQLASEIPLVRPLPVTASQLAPDDIPLTNSADGLEELTVPKRPKWRYDMTKVEVEANEEGLFRRWLAKTDSAVHAWHAAPASHNDASQEVVAHMPRAPSHFERNLEVWRQLWRVTEISEIMLCLLDSRCPLVHLPPSLATYLASQNSKYILVLTKVDIAGPVCVAAWISYLESQHPGVRIIQVESYTEQATAQGHAISRAHIPFPFREHLIHALREAHNELLEPPERVRADPSKKSRWRPSVKRSVDWEAVLRASGDKVGLTVGGATAPQPTDGEGNNDGGETPSEPEFLTIGLIGQPNVGKSSLLNALFGASKVRASRTPGKTKHYQTLFWTPDVRLVDCPGLVLPAYVEMDMQVLCGTLPISRVSAIPYCVHQIAQRMPLERMFNLTHPSFTESDTVDKRTWRAGMKASNRRPRSSVWTATDIMTAYALAKGWVTAKAGRPDVNRAGNAILRIVAEGRIPWAFWPPDVKNPNEEDNGAGIWRSKQSQEHELDIMSFDDSGSDLGTNEGEGSEEDSDSSAENGSHGSRAELDDESDGEENPEENAPIIGSSSRFSALSIDE